MNIIKLKKTIVTIVGARPQFIKLAALSNELRKFYNEVIIHTGQHYDYLMSDIFFEELGISKPDFNLEIHKKTHGSMTGEMLIKIEEKLIEIKPDLVLLYGDTNSTLAGALAASKLGIPIAHVEAGNRLGTLSNPEEINRKVTDHLSTLLFCSTESGVKFLANEGITKNVYFVGDPMYDMFLKLTNQRDILNIEIEDLNSKIIKLPDKYIYLTIHRQENTDDIKKLINILDAAELFEHKVIYPVHPRVNNILNSIFMDHKYKNIIFIKPLSYIKSINLVKNSIKVITDSGGVQREAFFAKIPCITVFDYVGWPETMIGNRNILTKPDKLQILSKINIKSIIDYAYEPFGDGESYKKIINYLKLFFENIQD